MRATVTNGTRHINVVLPDNSTLEEAVNRLVFLAQSMGEKAKVTIYWGPHPNVYRVKDGRLVRDKELENGNSEKRLTRRQAAIIGCATGTLLGPFADVHELAEELLEKPVHTHEFGLDNIQKEIKNKAYPLLMEIIAKE